MRDHVALEVRDLTGQTVADRESLRDGSAGGFDRLEDSRVVMHMVGRSRENEEDAYQVTARLAVRLSALTGQTHRAESYDRARHGGEGLPIDCVLIAEKTNDRQNDFRALLKFVQVTRAFGEQSFWKGLNDTGGATRELSANDLTSQLHSSVERKVERITSRDHRAKLILVLDASYQHAMLLSDVRAEFRRQHGDWAASVGFQEIWIVGRDAEHVHRLDRAQ